MRKTRLYNIWTAIRASLWFIPSVLVVAAFCTAFLMVSLDKSVEYQLLRQALHMGEGTILHNFIVVGPEGARSVLATVAASVITVAGVTFSITIVTLTLASSQFGPRLLTHFMQDRSTQFVLGAFVATFVYCLLVLRSVKTTQGDTFVPAISVNISVLLAVFNAGLLIYFIHNIASSIKAENVISNIFTNLKYNIDRIFKNMDPLEGRSGAASGLGSTRAEFCSDLIRTAARDGYLQAIDHQRLLELCVENDLLIELYLKAGNYSTRTTPLLRIWYVSEPEEEVFREIEGSFIIGNQRTEEQDVEFAIHQLVEIAVRSLSPGINDPFTAISCIDYLSSALCYLSGRHFPKTHCYDKDDRLRLVTKPVGFGDLLDTAFNQIRQHSTTSVAVTIRLMEAYGRIAESSSDQDQLNELVRHADMLNHSAGKFLEDRHDKEDLHDRYETFRKLVDNEQPKVSIPA